MFRLPRTLAVMIVVTIALHTLLLSLSLATSDPFSDTAPASGNRTMVVRYACVGCSGSPIYFSGSPTYFSTFQAASPHYARSSACNQSLRGIGTAVLPNRSADNEAGGSGAAAHGWDPSDMARPRAGLQVCISYKNSQCNVQTSPKNPINSLYSSRYYSRYSSDMIFNMISSMKNGQNS